MEVVVGVFKRRPLTATPSSYHLNGPWRPSAARETQSTPHTHPMFNETWRRTDSSDGTRKVVDVSRSASNRRGEGGVALAKEGTEEERSWQGWF